MGYKVAVKKGAETPFVFLYCFQLFLQVLIKATLLASPLIKMYYQILTRFSGAIYIASPSFTLKAL